MWKAILEVLGLGKEVVQARASLKKAKIEAEVETYRTAAQNAADWEKLAAQNAQASWLDEIWTAVLLVPLVLAFLGFSETVESGFKSLETVPEWYVWSVLASVSFAFARHNMPKIASWLRKQ